METKEGHLCHLHQREQPVQRHGDLRARLDSRLASWLCVVGFKQRTVVGSLSSVEIILWHLARLAIGVREPGTKAVGNSLGQEDPEPDLSGVDCPAWGGGWGKTVTHPGVAADSHSVLILSQETQLPQPALASATFPKPLPKFLV